MNDRISPDRTPADCIRLSRRRFLQVLAAGTGVLMVGIRTASASDAPLPLAMLGDNFNDLGAYVRIDSDGNVLIGARDPDTGTGVATSLPRIIADELDADWNRVSVVPLGLGVSDSNGQPLDGAHRYEMHFAKGALPPVNAFWSLTVYNDRQLLVQNPISRYAIGDRDKLKNNPDGSLTIYIQHNAPAKAHIANWLPTPAGPFNIFLRMYWPKPDLVEGHWQIPPIERVD